LIRRATIWLGIVVLAAACAGGGSNGKTGGGPKGCVCAAPGCPTVSFNGNIQPIFNRSCATNSQCHGTNGAQGLDLTTGHSIPDTVNVKATQQPKLFLVKPGVPANSYLYQKITLQPPAISGISMPQGCPGNPLGGAVCMSPDDVSAMAQWITECATNTPSLP
jgi:hypothetical protein